MPDSLDPVYDFITKNPGTTLDKITAALQGNYVTIFCGINHLKNEGKVKSIPRAESHHLYYAPNPGDERKPGQGPRPEQYREADNVTPCIKAMMRNSWV